MMKSRIEKIIDVEFDGYMNSNLKYNYMKIGVICVILFFGISCFQRKIDSHTNIRAAISIENLKCEYLSSPMGVTSKSPRLSWELVSDERDIQQTAYQIIVASSVEKLSANQGDIWDSHKINSNSTINISYEGKPLSSGIECFWKVRVWTTKGETGWSLPSKWTMALLKNSDWKAKWIGLDKSFPGEMPDSLHSRLAARYFRKEFKASGKIKKATAYICGLGLYELYINGNKVGNQVLAPTLSDYSKRVYYNTFDVTELIVDNKNAIGVILGNGRFFSMRPKSIPGFGSPTIINYGFPKMLFQLELEMEDGTKETILSDEFWKVTADGPIRSNNEYDGEEYNALKEMPGWNKPDFNDSDWESVQLVDPPSKNIVSQPNPNIKVMDEIQPVSVNTLKRGIYIFDMGQNMSGWVQVTAQGAKGATLKMRFAERINEDGSLYTTNLRTAEATDKYIFKGEGEETWEPTFVCHGFRYVEVTGLSYEPNLKSLTGKVVYDQMETIGHIETSSEMLNSIYKAACWTICSNYRGAPIDCPQRDERMAFLGDRSTNSYGESFIFDNNVLYSKWLTDITDAQKQTGSIPDIAPWEYGPIYGCDNMTWPSSLILVADNLYRQFGNVNVIHENYDAMKKWLFYMRDTYMKDYLLPQDNYGDWCMPPDDPKVIHCNDPRKLTPGDFIGSAYFYYCLNIMGNFAQLLQKEEDANEYTSLADKVRNAINDNYLNKDSLYYANNTVTANALALYFGIPSEEIRSKVFDNLVYKTTHEFKSHTSTGLIGGQWIMRTLTDNGRPDLAFTIATNKDYPSWGYMIENDATTIWELWNGNTAAPEMNSGNHVMLLGDLLIWYYENLAGIKSSTEHPGFKEIIMNPKEMSNLEFVNASYHSIHGLIKSNWKWEKDKFYWDISIPANTTAIIHVPINSSADVREGKKNVDESVGVEFLRMENGRAVYKIKSGTYNITAIR
uniref:alpha-L-rhamnosidase n=1 Tax=uncultured Draconibacterium sp. TaxID=1573823 RepID=UPI00321755EA